MVRFGSARLVRTDVGRAHKLQWLVSGVADPGHYLRSLYFRRALESLEGTFEEILDAGCGSGDYTFYLAKRFPQATVTAFDIDEQTISRNRRVQRKMGIRNVSFHVRDVSTLTESDKYDLIVCIDVLEHIKDVETAVRSLKTALAPRGYLYIHMPARRYRPVPFSRFLSSFHRWAEREHIGRLLTKEELRGLLGDNGLSVLACRSTFSYFAGEMAVSLFSLFFEQSKVNFLMQGLMFPIARCLCYFDPLVSEQKGFGVAALAQKAP